MKKLKRKRASHPFKKTLKKAPAPHFHPSLQSEENKIHAPLFFLWKREKELCSADVCNALDRWQYVLKYENNNFNVFLFKLVWGSCIASNVKAASKKLGFMIRSLKFLSPAVAHYLYKSTVEPCIEYCYCYDYLAASWKR